MATDFHVSVRAAAKAVGGQVKLAHLVGCSQARISWLMTAAPSIRPDTALKIAKATRGTQNEITLSQFLPQEMIADFRAELERESAT